MILVKQGFALLLLWKALKTHTGWRVFLFRKFFSQSQKGDSYYEQAKQFYRTIF